MTHSGRWFLDAGDKVFSGMGATADPKLEEFLEKNEGLGRSDVFFLQVAHGFAPDPVTPKTFLKRGPYGNPKALKKDMKGSVERGWLEVVGEGEYGLTDKGKKMAKEIFAFVEKLYGGVEALPDSDMERITALLGKVVEEAKALPEPDLKWGLSWGSMFERGPKAPWVIQVRRRMLDLFAFRDDVHIAAWQPYDVKGYVWEAFTYVWREEAATAAELVEKLAYREFDEEVYAAALEELVGRGWIAEEEGRYVATEKGRALRQEAEDATDRYFDAAWAALDEAETKEIKGLLEKLAEAVKPPEEEETG